VITDITDDQFNTMLCPRVYLHNFLPGTNKRIAYLVWCTV